MRSLCGSVGQRDWGSNNDPRPPFSPRRRIPAAAIVIALIGALLVSLAAQPAAAQQQPDTPSGLALAPGDGALTVSWDSQPELYYYVRWSVPGSGVWSNPARSSALLDQTVGVLAGQGASSYRVTGLTNGLMYAVHVRAASGSQPLTSNPPGFTKVFGTPAAQQSPGMVATPAGLTVAEGDSGQYRLALTSEPAHDVTVALASSDEGAVTVAPSSLVFTSASWGTSQPVTVTSVADSDNDDEAVIISYTITSDDSDYSSLASGPTAVSVDDDEPSGDAALSGLELSAAGRGIGFASATTDYAVSVHNSVASTTVTATARHRGATIRAGLAGATAPATSGVAGAAIPLSVGSNAIQVVVTAENGAATTYTVTVKREASNEAGPRNPRLISGAGQLTLLWDHADPTITPNPQDAGDELNGYKIRWSVPGSGNWSNPTGEHGERLRHSEPTEYTMRGLTNHKRYSVHIASAGSNSWTKVFAAPAPQPAPNGMTLTAGDGELTLTWERPDDDPYHAVRWREAGSGSWLNPAGTSIAGTQANGVLIEPGPAVYRITGLANDTEYEVQLKARPDSGRDEQSGLVSTAGSEWAAASATPGASAKTYSIADVVAREGDDATLTVTLSRPAPAGGVAFSVTADFSGSASAADAGTAPFAVTVAEGRRSASFIIPVIADSEVEAAETFSVTVTPNAAGWTAAVSSATGRRADTATVTIVGPDATVTPTSLAVDEGATATYTIALTSAPAHDVVVTPVSGDAGAVAVSPGSLTFTPSDWWTAQTVTVSGVADTDSDDESVSVTHTVTSDDTAYSSLTPTAVSVTVADAGVAVVAAPTSLAVDEGASATYTIALTSAPAHDVVVTPVSGDAAVATVSGALTFTAGTWQTPQPVTVTGVADTDSDDETVSITHTITSDDTAFSSLTAPSVSVAVTDKASMAGDATLGALELSAASGGIGFASATTHYTTRVHHNTASTTVTATAHHPAATMTVGLRGGTPAPLADGAASDPIALSIGSNVIEVAVTAPNGAAKTYAVEVFRELSIQSYPLNARLIPGSERLTLVWDSGSAQTTTYGIRWRRAGSDRWLNPSGANGEVYQNNPSLPVGHAISGLANGTLHAVQIRAGGPWVEVFGIPGALDWPRGVTLMPGDGELTIAWDAPPDDVYHAVRWRCADVVVPGCRNTAQKSILNVPDNGVLVEPGATSYTITGLVNARQYVVLVKARSSAGQGEELFRSSSVGTAWVEVRGAPAAGTKTYSLSGARVREGGDAALVVTLNEAAPSGGIAFSIAADFSGTASAADVGDVPLSVTVPAGARRAAFIIAALADAEAESSEAFTVAVATEAPGWTAASPRAATATVTIADAPAAAPQVSLADAAIEVDEGAGHAAVTVQVAGSRPAAAEVTLTVADGTAARGSDYGGGGTATFFVPAWQNGAAATLNIPITDDTDEEDDETFTVTITGVSDGHSIGSSKTTTVTIADNDDAVPPGFTVTPTTLEVLHGHQATYTIVLNTKPASSVTVTPRSSDPQAVLIRGVAVFTPSDWDVPQTITAEGLKATDQSLSITHQVGGHDSEYSVIAADSVSVTVKTRTFSIDDVTVDESEDAELAITLSDPAPPGGVAFSVAVSYPGTSPASAQDLGTPLPSTATVSEGETMARVTVPITDDDVVEDSETFRVTVSTSAPGWWKKGNGAAIATVTIADDDETGVTVTAQDPVSLREGNTSTYTVVLDAEPEDSVTITPRSSDPQAVRTSGAVTFQPSEWDDPKTITVYAIHDDDNLDEQATISHEATGSAGYSASLAIDSVDVEVADDEPGVVVTAQDPVSLTEGGNSTYTVVLKARPSRATRIILTSSDPQAVRTSGTVTFQPSEWDKPKTITVYAIHDDDNLDEQVTISHEARGPLGYNHHLAIDSVAVEVADDEAKSSDASLTSLSLSAGGASRDITQFGSATDFAWAVKFDTASLTVTPVTAHEHAQVTVDGTAVASGEESGALTLSPGANAIDVVVTAQDGTAVTYTVTVTRLAAPSKLTLTAANAAESESAGTVTVTATLDNPAGSSGVPVTLTAASGSSATAGEDFTLPVQFTIAAGQTAATADVAVVDDAVEEDDESMVLGATTAAGITVTGVTVEITDNDTAALAFTAPPLLRAIEGGTATYHVALGSEPAAGVTVTPVSANPAVATVSSALAFDAQNWKTPQPVTVTGVKAADAAVSITHTVTSDDSKYTGLASDPLSAVVEDGATGDAALVSLELSAAPGSIDFASAVPVYMVSAHHSFSSTTVTATTRQPGATMTAGLRGETAQALTSGVASNPIPLSPGQNVIDVVVSASDGTKKTYVAVVTLEQAGEAAARNVRVIPGDGRLTVLWDHADPTKAPSSNPLDRYNLRWSVPGSGRWLNPHRQNGAGLLHNQRTEYTISGLSNGTEYAVQIQAMDSTEGQQSANTRPWVKVYGTPSALDAPTGVTLTPGDGELTIAWDAPPDDVYHAVRWRCADRQNALCLNPLADSILGDQGNGVLVEPGDTSYTITGLTNAQQYTVEVKARPSAGHGESRGPSSAGSSWVAASGTPVAGAKAYSLSGTRVREGGDAVLAVTLSEAAPSGGVAFSIVPDFAATASEDDAGNIPVSVTVPADARRATFAIPIGRDASTEGDETFAVTVTAQVLGWTAASPGADSATVTIIDGPTTVPAASLTATAVEVREDAGHASLTVQVASHNPTAAEVTLTLADGTAARGSDYRGSGTVAVFVPAGLKGDTAELSIPIIADTDMENDETFTVTITAVSDGHGIGSPDSATVTIADWTAGMTFNPSTLEVPSGASVTYTVVLDAQPSRSVTITPRSSDPQAVRTSGAVTFQPSEWDDPKTITVSGLKASDQSITIAHRASSLDSRYDGQTASLAVTAAEGKSTDATLGALLLSAGAIAPDFDASITAYTLSVPNSTASTTVTATVAATGKATLKAGLQGSLSAAVSGEATGAISLSTGANTIEVEVTAESGGTETYAVTVTRGGTGVPGAPAGLSAEAAASALSVSWQPPADVGANALDGYDVQYKTTAAADQAAATADDPSSGWVDAGHTGTATTATISGLTNGTSYDVRVRATNGVAPGSAWATASGTPSSPPIWITEATAGGPGELVVKWSRGPGVDTGYRWRWRVKSPQGQWLPSAQGKGSFRTRGVTLTGLTEGETYEVQVNGVSWRSIGSPTPWSPIAEGTAGETSEPKTFSVTSAVTAAEGGDAELVITLSEAAPTGGVEFDVTVSYGSGAAAADSGDVTAPGATVTVASGETSATVSIPIARDADEEGDETLTVAFAPTGTGASEWAEKPAGAGTATVTITDTTETVKFKRTKAKVGETRDGPSHTVRITRTGDVTRPVEVTLVFADGTATSPDDYRAYQDNQRTVTIAAGRRHRDVMLPIVNDKVAEDKETFTVTLTTATSGYAVGDPLVVKIDDDDVAGVVLPETALTVDEKDTVKYKLKLATKPTHDVTITATSDDPLEALLGRDPSRTRTFTPENWNNAQTLTVRAKPIGDASVTISHTAVSDDPKYDGIAIEPVTVTIANVYDLPDAVNNLQFSVEGTSVTVTWTAPDTPGQVSRYYVKVMPVDGTAGETKERLRRPRAAGEQMSETFRNLVPGATYKISVRAVGMESSGKGERTWTEEFTIPAGGQPEQPPPG